MQIKRKILAYGTRVLDLNILSLSLLIGLYLFAPVTPAVSFTELIYIKIEIVNLFAFFILLYTWNRIFYHFGLYQKRRLDNQLKEWFDIFKAVSFSALALAVTSFFFWSHYVNPNVILVFWGGSLLLLIPARTLVRFFLVYLRSHGRNLRHIVFVGSGPRAQTVAQKLLRRRDLGYRFLGFVDDNFMVSASHPVDVKDRLCDLEAFPSFLEHHVVDEVFIVLPIKSYYEKITEVLELCQELGVICRVPSDWFKFKISDHASYVADGVPIYSMQTGTHRFQDSLWLKRLFDIFLSSAMILLFAPLMLLIAVSIKLSSSGPVLFRQERIGYNRRRFKMLKFRTMIKDAETMIEKLEHLNESDGPTFKIKNDPRITPFGHFLRRTSLDELPQLFNILLGDMSIVGPRPLPVRDVEGFTERWHKRRFSMRPGLTCLWQINGRNELSFWEWMRLDLEYIDNWSISLDLKIMFKTVPTIIKATGQ